MGGGGDRLPESSRVSSRAYCEAAFAQIALCSVRRAAPYSVSPYCSTYLLRWFLCDKHWDKDFDKDWDRDCDEDDPNAGTEDVQNKVGVSPRNQTVGGIQPRMRREHVAVGVSPRG